MPRWEAPRYKDSQWGDPPGRQWGTGCTEVSGQHSGPQWMVSWNSSGNVEGRATTGGTVGGRTVGGQTVEIAQQGGNSGTRMYLDSNTETDQSEWRRRRRLAGGEIGPGRTASGQAWQLASTPLLRPWGTGRRCTPRKPAVARGPCATYHRSLTLELLTTGVLVQVRPVWSQFRTANHTVLPRM